MAWQEVETDVGNKVGRCGYSVHLKHGGARVSVPEAIATELGWTTKTRFKLQVGAGELEGSLRIVADPKGKIAGKAPPNKGAGLTIRLGRWPALAPRNVDRVTVDHEVQKEAGALVVRLPTHALSVAPTPRPAPSAPQAQVSRLQAGAGAKTDVTNKFFNDPKTDKAGMASGLRGQR